MPSRRGVSSIRRRMSFATVRKFLRPEVTIRRMAYPPKFLEFMIRRLTIVYVFLDKQTVSMSTALRSQRGKHGIRQAY